MALSCKRAGVSASCGNPVAGAEARASTAASSVAGIAREKLPIVAAVGAAILILGFLAFTVLGGGDADGSPSFAGSDGSGAGGSGIGVAEDQEPSWNQFQDDERNEAFIRSKVRELRVRLGMPLGNVQEE